MAEHNLQESRYSSVSETDIRHAGEGEVMLQGHVRAQGIHVQRSKVRKAIHDLDPSVTTRKRTAIQAVRKYGRPRRIRSDHGGEDALVWRDMNSTWGEDARPVIVGSSVHDQRIGTS